MSSALGGFRRLLLPIGGANIAGADRALATAAFLTPSQPAATAEAGPFRRLAARSFVQASGAIRAVRRQLRRWVSDRGSHESVKISLISSDAHRSKSVSFSDSPPIVELAGRGTRTVPTASLTTLPG
jgi:hypothetical protein